MRGRWGGRAHCDVRIRKEARGILVFSLFLSLCDRVRLVSSARIPVVDPVTSPGTFRSVLTTHAAVIGDTVAIAALNVLAPDAVRGVRGPPITKLKLDRTRFGKRKLCIVALHFCCYEFFRFYFNFISFYFKKIIKYRFVVYICT